MKEDDDGKDLLRFGDKEVEERKNLGLEMVVGKALGLWMVILLSTKCICPEIFMCCP